MIQYDIRNKIPTEIILVFDTIIRFWECFLMAIEIFKEKRVHSSRLVPFSYYASCLSDYFSNVPLHWHKEFELNYIISGRGEFICGDNRFIFEEGDIIILQPDVLHAVYENGGSVKLYDTLVFSAEMLVGTGTDRSSLELFLPLANGSLLVDTRITKSHERYSELASCVREIFKNAKRNTPLCDVILKSELLRFFAILAESGNVHSADCKAAAKSELIRPALEFINGHFTENITIEQLAEISHLSRSYFMSCFKNAAGVGAIEYINQIRIKAVCELLRTDDRTISGIAFGCGFTNLANFNRQFKRQVGTSPKEYRKRYGSVKSESEDRSDEKKRQGSN